MWHQRSRGYFLGIPIRATADPNAFVQRLIDETRISHVWEPVQTKIPDGRRRVVTWRFRQHVANRRERVPKTQREAKDQALQILWNIWKRFSPRVERRCCLTVANEVASRQIATSFANFLLDNIDLVRQLEDAKFREPAVDLDPILSELERRAQAHGLILPPFE
jgi:hypothetical protein